MVALADKTIVVELSPEQATTLKPVLEQVRDDGEVVRLKLQSHRLELVTHIKHCKEPTCIITQEHVDKIDEDIKQAEAAKRLFDQIIEQL